MGYGAVLIMWSDLTDVVEVMQQGISGARSQVVLAGVLRTLSSFPLQLHALLCAGVRFQRCVLISTAMSVSKQTVAWVRFQVSRRRV
jgi:hypothetical protein